MSAARIPAALVPAKLIPALLWLAAAPAAAQDHQHRDHETPATPAPLPQAHEGHDMEGMEDMDMPAPDAPPTPEHQGMDHGAMDHGRMDHGSMDHGAMPDMAAPPAAPTTAPPVPADHAADALFDPAAMARARAALAAESGGMVHNMILVDQFEAQRRDGRTGYRWQGEAWLGGDIDRLTIKSQGEGGARLDSAEVQALWSHAIDPWFNLQAGIRQDIRPTPARTYAAIGIEGIAPYWFKIEATAFLSDRGNLSARMEASHDIRLTQRLLLSPRAEVDLAAQGSALREIEAGLRLGYMIDPRFTPYVGIEWRGVYGAEGRAMRAAGDDPRRAGAVAGLRFWF